MNYRQLGKTELHVSDIGFGAWGIGGTANGSVAYGQTDDAESKRALKYAFDLGVTFYDTSNLYGFGHSEKLIGEALRDVRDQVIVASKVGFVDAETQDFSPAYIQQSIERSLQNIQTDYIDLYQLHSPSIDILQKDDEIVSVLQKLQKEGKIRHYGISLRSPEDGVIAVREFGFQVIQVNFNMIDQRALENGLLDFCKDENVGVIIRTPLCFGFLTGAYSNKNSFEDTDHRSKWSAEQIDVWANAYNKFEAGITEHQKQTPAQIALRFCLSYSSISSIIPGMLTTKHVEENIAASDLGPFSQEQYQYIEDMYKKNEFFIRS